MQALPFPSCAVLPPTPGCLADVYFFKIKSILLQEAFVWWLFRARQHGCREKADWPVPSFHQGEQRRKGQPIQAKPCSVL